MSDEKIVAQEKSEPAAKAAAPASNKKATAASAESKPAPAGKYNLVHGRLVLAGGKVVGPGTRDEPIEVTLSAEDAKFLLASKVVEPA